MRRPSPRLACLAMLGLIAACGQPQSASSPQGPSNRPRLVVVISIDQFRADYLNRFDRFYLPAKSGSKVGGFNFLKTTGANYVDGHQAHSQTETGPGHAAILTGSAPSLNGIVANSWYDRATRKNKYCADDALSETVGGRSGPMSPRNLLVSTVGDELKMATNGLSKVVGIAYKDRASIFMAGHAADTVVWIDPPSGDWVSSTFYFPNKKLPQWVVDVNAKKTIAGAAGVLWEPLLQNEAYSITRPSPATKPGTDGKPFSHRIGTPGTISTSAFIGSHRGNEYMLETIKAGVEAERLGIDGYPDILAINLSSNDYIGHAYGPNSPEVMDASVRTDRMLSDLFNYLDQKVGLARTVIILTADHGVVPVVEEARSHFHLSVERRTLANLERAVNKALSDRYGEGKYVAAASDPSFYLDHALLETKKADLREARDIAARAAARVEDVYVAFSHEQVMEGRLPNSPWTSGIALGHHPKLGGDLMVFTNPGDYFGSGNGTGHGTPWAYDSHVPIIFRGWGVSPGRFARRVTVMDIAPTLCHLLGIEYPNGNLGKPLFEALPVKQG